MAIDVKSYKKRFLHDQKPNINLVPFIDILFTIMIFLVVTSNFSAVDSPMDATDSGATVLSEFRRELWMRGKYRLGRERLLSLLLMALVRIKLFNVQKPNLGEIVCILGGYYQLE